MKQLIKKPLKLNPTETELVISALTTYLEVLAAIYKKALPESRNREDSRKQLQATRRLLKKLGVT